MLTTESAGPRSVADTHVTFRGKTKYAPAPRCASVSGAERTLRFTVSDDRTGYDARQTPMGSGQRNTAGRLAVLGGRLEVRSGPPLTQGTGITAQLPAPPRCDKVIVSTVTTRNVELESLPYRRGRALSLTGSVAPLSDRIVSYFDLKNLDGGA